MNFKWIVFFLKLKIQIRIKIDFKLEKIISINHQLCVLPSFIILRTFCETIDYSLEIIERCSLNLKSVQTLYREMIDHWIIFFCAYQKFFSKIFIKKVLKNRSVLNFFRIKKFFLPFLKSKRSVKRVKRFVFWWIFDFIMMLNKW